MNKPHNITITDTGRKRIVDDYAKAVEHERISSKVLDEAVERVDLLREALNCEHPPEEIEDLGTAMIIQTRCRKCGYVWYD